MTNISHYRDSHSMAMSAVANGDMESLVFALIQRQPERDGDDAQHHENASGETMLHVAIKALKLDVVKFLITWDLAGVDTPTEDDRHTPLLTATLSSYGVDDVVDFLIAKGADVNRVARDGRTPLHCAASMNRQLVGGGRVSRNRETKWRLPSSSTAVSTALVETLIDAGAKVDALDNDGNTPLHSATNRGWYDVDVVRCLVGKNADVNRCNLSGQTPLHNACGHQGTIKVVEFLLQTGADTCTTDDGGNTPLDVARLCNNHTAETLLSKIRERTAVNPSAIRPGLSAWSNLGETTSMLFMPAHH